MVDVEGFEGPLDLLLDLARRQKVDLAKISILALVEQYLEFIEAARRVRLELAADYLVMAAWLAYLKSRLLLPEPPKGEEPSAADLASALAERLGTDPDRDPYPLLLASAAIGVLRATMSFWAASGGAVPLDQLTDAAFRALATGFGEDCTLRDLAPPTGPGAPENDTQDTERTTTDEFL